MPERRAAIVTALRTPFGRYGGALSTVRPDDLAAHIIRAVVDQSGVDPASIADVYFGAANQAGEDNRNVARMAALLAGLPDSVPGSTVNRLCASGLESVNIAARMIESGCGDVYIAGGTESMSRAPFAMAKSYTAFNRQPEIYDTTIGWRFTNPKLAELYHPYSMGETAENVARRHDISREDQDRFAVLSQQRWALANEMGFFDDELVPVNVPQRKGDPVTVSVDEHPRPTTTLDALTKLRPAFSKEDGASVTAGNSSGVNDGAAALLLMELEEAKRQGLEPLAIVGPHAAAGVDPAIMGLGPVAATKSVLDRSGHSIDDLDLIELNEAFAAQSLACVRELGLDIEKVNVNGGAIAIGHPLGASGARLAATLVHEMKRRDSRLGLATLCIGVGQDSQHSSSVPDTNRPSKPLQESPMSGAANPVMTIDPSEEDQDKLAEFESQIADGVLIEPGDWMPQAYRMGMLRMAEHHANSEIVGALPEGEWITRAPSLRRKLALTAKVQDEVGHGQMLYRVSQDLGKSREDMLRDLCTGKTKYHNCFNYPAPSWADIAMVQWLIDGAAIMNQKTLADGAYGPYVRTMHRINMEEAFHFKSGEDMVLTLMSGTKKQKAMTQEAFDRWWGPSVMFFGPHDKPNCENLPPMKWRMKTESNDSLRQRFVNRFAPAALDLGLVIHVCQKDEHGMVTSKTVDEQCKLDETTGNWGVTDPDWDEFFRVIRGHGPCNAHRVALRRFSYEQGAWVRRAIAGGATTLPPAA